MAKIAKSVVDSELRTQVFDDVLVKTADVRDFDYEKINDRQFGCILTDLNGVERYVRLGVIVAEIREDMTARELMEREIADYNNKQVKKAEKAEARAKKAEADKARREAKAKEKEGE